MRTALALILCLASSAAFGQAAVHQQGPITPNNIPRWNDDHAIEDAGGLYGKNGMGVNPFAITDNLGPGIQLNTASTNGEYHALSFGHNAAGAPVFNIDGTEFPFGQGNGDVVGPGASTVNEFAVWNAATGKVLKNAAGGVVGHAGGMTATDTSAPTPFVGEPSFGFNWKTPNLFQLTETTTHVNEFHTTVAILNNSTGSGANGPAHDDNALILGCNRTNYLTTTVLGELGCQWAYQTQGARGDSAVYLAASRHVDDPTQPNWGVILWEGTASLITPTTGTPIREIHPTIGFGITGFQDITNVTSGAGGTCRITVTNTANISFASTVIVTGVRGAPECNGNWAATVINGTQFDLANSVLLGTYLTGGVAGASASNIGGPTFGFQARAQTGRNGVAFMVNRSPQPTTSTWGSAFRVQLENETSVSFDMDTWGHAIIQPVIEAGAEVLTGFGSMLDAKYALTLVSAPGASALRWTGSTTVVPRDNPEYPASAAFPGGGALGWNFCAGSPGCAASELWNLYTAASSSFIVYQKTGAATYSTVLNVSVNGSTLLSTLSLPRVVTSDTTFMASSSATWANAAAALTATLTNSPKTGNPTKWIAVLDNGTTRYIPAW